MNKPDKIHAVSHGHNRSLKLSSMILQEDHLTNGNLIQLLLLLYTMLLHPVVNSSLMPKCSELVQLTVFNLKLAAVCASFFLKSIFSALNNENKFMLVFFAYMRSANGFETHCALCVNHSCLAREPEPC